MEFISKCLALVDAFSALARAGRIATLENEAWYQAMEFCIVVVAVKTMLEEGAGCEGRLLCEELEEEVAGGGGEEDFGCWRWLEVVELRHDDDERIKAVYDLCSTLSIALSNCHIRGLDAAEY